MATDASTSTTISHVNWRAAVPAQLVLYATWDQAAIVGVPLPEGPLQLPSFTLSWILLATGLTKSPRKHLIDRDSQRCTELITAPLSSLPRWEHWLLSRRGANDGGGRLKGYDMCCLIKYKYVFSLSVWGSKKVMKRLPRFVEFTFATQGLFWCTVSALQIRLKYFLQA